MDLNLKETELCLGLPGGGQSLLRDQNIKKRGFSQTVDLKLNLDDSTTPIKNMNNPPKENSSNKDSLKPPTKSVSFLSLYIIFMTYIIISATNLEFSFKSK